MITALAFAILSQGPVGPVEGRCQYGPALVERAKETATVLTDCNTFKRTTNGSEEVFEFGRRSWGPSLRLSGTMHGNALTVTSLRTRSGTLEQARGDCEMFFREGELHRVACLAKGRTLWHSVNFVVSDL